MPLLIAFQRLIDLLAEPKDIPILAPIIQREILYRLLVGDQGARLRQIASAGSQSHQIAQAIDWLKRHYTLPLRIEDLAAHVHMSPSTFHHHFRALTAMSPLQYQKWLRLNEARRLMLMERLDAATAAFQVGYESPSQFSREYRRMFGAPPLRDITSLRQMAGSAPAYSDTRGSPEQAYKKQQSILASVHDEEEKGGLTSTHMMDENSEFVHVYRGISPIIGELSLSPHRCRSSRTPHPSQESLSKRPGNTNTAKGSLFFAPHNRGTPYSREGAERSTGVERQV